MKILNVAMVTRGGYNRIEILPRKGVRGRVTLYGMVGFNRGFEKGPLCASGESDFEHSCTP